MGIIITISQWLSNIPMFLLFPSWLGPGCDSLLGGILVAGLGVLVQWWHLGRKRFFEATSRKLAEDHFTIRNARYKPWKHMKTYGPSTMNHQTCGPYGWPEPPDIFGFDMIEHDAKSSTVSLVWRRLVYDGEILHQNSWEFPIVYGSS
jgi:hypothetical protein